MTNKELKEAQYYIPIEAKYLKTGMKIIDEDDCDDPNSETHLFVVTNVAVDDEKVTFSVEGFIKEEKRIRDFTYELFRTPVEPVINIYFSSLEEGVYFGFPLNYIKKYERR